MFNAKNVTLAPLGGATLVLGAANQTASAANLTVTSATGSIGNAGAVKVSGDATWEVRAGCHLPDAEVHRDAAIIKSLAWEGERGQKAFAIDDLCLLTG